MLAWRLLLSAILIPLAIGLFYADAWCGPAAPVLFALCVLAALRGTWELHLLLRRGAVEPSFGVAAAGVLAVLAAGWIPHAISATARPAPPPTALLLACAGAVMLVLLAGACRYRQPGRNLHNLAAEWLTVGYVGLLLAVTMQLRWLAGAEAGYLLLGSAIVSAKAGDIGAYTLGRLFGRRKLAPRLSPGKTWMGGFGGLLFAALAAWAWLHFTPPLFNPAWRPPAAHWSLLYGMLMGLAGLFGDLCESLIKRDVGAKDAAPLPGFGGLLDVLDSILFAGPVAYVLWLILPLRTW